MSSGHKILIGIGIAYMLSIGITYHLYKAILVGAGF